MVSKEVADSAAHTVYVILIILAYLWFVAFVLPEFITFHQLIMWLAMQVLLYPIFAVAVLVAARGLIGGSVRWVVNLARRLLGRILGR
jgi:multisubunit Na+/H+ antiporter MnhG subunit